jgi:hypothetical protein
VLLVALIVANGLNIAAGLAAIGSGMQLLQAGPTWLWALVAGALTTTLLVMGSFARIALAFKLLCAALLSYLVVAVLAPISGAVSSATLIPHVELNKAYLALLVAVRARPFRRTSSSGRAPTASKRCATNPRTEQRHNRSSGRASNGPGVSSPPAASTS